MKSLEILGRLLPLNLFRNQLLNRQMLKLVHQLRQQHLFR